MTSLEQVRRLASLSQSKAHIEAVRRLQLAFEKELHAAGVKGVDVNGALALINSAIGAREDVVGTDYDDVYFELTK